MLPLMLPRLARHARLCHTPALMSVVHPPQTQQGAVSWTKQAFGLPDAVHTLGTSQRTMSSLTPENVGAMMGAWSTLSPLTIVPACMLIQQMCRRPSLSVAHCSCRPTTSECSGCYQMSWLGNLFCVLAPACRLQGCLQPLMPYPIACGMSGLV